MHLRILALDLDGTIAENDVVANETWAALRKVKAAGFTLILVTGRRLNALTAIRPFEEVCEAIVAENGAAIYFPRNDTIMLPFGRIAHEVVDKLQTMNIPLERGLAICATWRPHDKIVLEVLSETSYAATIEYNKGAVMVLPPGATKGTGLLTALRELGFSPHNVVAFGDAENDRSLFEQAELAIAVANTAPDIKEIADVVLADQDGAGVRNLIDKLMNGNIPQHLVRPKQKISVGQSLHKIPAIISPFDLINSNLGVFGESGSGKSWIAGMLAEKLLQQEYQICIIDPEGDHRGIRAFPHTLLLGGDRTAPPSVTDVIVLMEYSDISLILDLSLYSMSEQIKYVNDLMHALCSLRQRRGKPHWFLIDEVHYFCQHDDDPLTKLFFKYMQEGGLGLVSYRPSSIAPSLLNITNNWLLTRMRNPDEQEILRKYLDGQQCSDSTLEMISSLTSRQAYLCLGKTVQKKPPPTGVIAIESTSRKVTHVRHLHKYLQAPLPHTKQFHFYIEEPDYKGPRTAASLWEFNEVIALLPAKTLEYHLARKDFEKWLINTLHDPELARRLRKVSNRKLEGEMLREVLSATISARYDELQSLI